MTTIKKFLVILISIVVLGCAGFFVWNQYEERMTKEAIAQAQLEVQKAVQKKADDEQKAQADAATKEKEYLSTERQNVMTVREDIRGFLGIKLQPQGSASVDEAKVKYQKADQDMSVVLAPEEVPTQYQDIHYQITKEVSKIQMEVRAGLIAMNDDKKTDMQKQIDGLMPLQEETITFIQEIDDLMQKLPVKN